MLAGAGGRHQPRRARPPRRRARDRQRHRVPGAGRPGARPRRAAPQARRQAQQARSCPIAGSGRAPAPARRAARVRHHQGRARPRTTSPDKEMKIADAGHRAAAARRRDREAGRHARSPRPSTRARPPTSTPRAPPTASRRAPRPTRSRRAPSTSTAPRSRRGSPAASASTAPGLAQGRARVKYRVAASVQVGGDARSPGYSITPSGNAAFDAAAQPTLEGSKGQSLPPPPENYPDVAQQPNQRHLRLPSEPMRLNRAPLPRRRSLASPSPLRAPAAAHGPPPARRRRRRRTSNDLLGNIVVVAGAGPPAAEDRHLALARLRHRRRHPAQRGAPRPRPLRRVRGPARQRRARRGSTSPTRPST